jgi:hypothetical protein
MSLDELNLDSGEVGWNGQEATAEKSEKQKESSRKAQSQLQKTQKDEKKAKWDNDDLFLLLSRFIQNPLYEDLITPIVALLKGTYPSRFILIIISLVYPEAAHYIFEKIKKIVPPATYTQIHRYHELRVFHQEDIHASIRDWVTLWMTSTQEFLSDKEWSIVLEQKTLNLLQSDAKKIAQDGISIFFTFFLASKNVSIEQKKSQAYAEFILSEYEKVIRDALENADIDLRLDSTVDVKSLFGMN